MFFWERFFVYLAKAELRSFGKVLGSLKIQTIALFWESFGCTRKCVRIAFSRGRHRHGDIDTDLL